MATAPSTDEDCGSKEGSSSSNKPTLCVHIYSTLFNVKVFVYLHYCL